MNPLCLLELHGPPYSMSTSSPRPCILRLTRSCPPTRNGTTSDRYPEVLTKNNFSRDTPLSKTFCLVLQPMAPPLPAWCRRRLPPTHGSLTFLRGRFSTRGWRLPATARPPSWLSESKVFLCTRKKTEVFLMAWLLFRCRRSY